MAREGHEPSRRDINEPNNFRTGIMQSPTR